MTAPLQVDLDFLAHHGVKGQKWGVRRATKKAARQRNRQLNRESRDRDESKRVAGIEKARAQVKSGKAANELNTARGKYQQNKMNLGSREAKKILRAKQEKYNETVATSKEAKNGKEAAVQAMKIVGMQLLIGSVSAAAR